MCPQTVLITGASRGLGAAAARAAAQSGAQVALTARTAGDLESLAEEIRAAGGEAIAIPGDVSLAEDCRRVVEQTVERFGKLDSLLNNAGIIEPIAPIAAAEAGAWERNLAVNLLGPVLMTQAALPHLKETSGRVINVSTGASINVIPGWAAYSAAKVALNHFTRILAAEEPGITAIAVRFAAVDTEMQAVIRREGFAGMPESAYARYMQLYHDRQLLSPEIPGRTLAVLALAAPAEWSGELIIWNDGRIRSLVNRFFPSSM